VTKDEATARARADLAGRLGVAESQITSKSVADATFGDGALGAAIEDEMAASMMTDGWRITLAGPDGTSVEYRGNANQLRLYRFRGKNYKI
jgi:hypothetical protein